MAAQGNTTHPLGRPGAASLRGLPAAPFWSTPEGFNETTQRSDINVVVSAFAMRSPVSTDGSVIREPGPLRIPGMRLNEQRWVDLPKSKVFAYTADFSNIADWDPGVAASEKVTEGPIGVGTEFDLQVRFGLGTIPMRYRITEYEPDTRVVLIGRGKPLEAVDEIRFETDGDLTRIDYTADLAFFNSLRFLGPLLSPALNKVGKKAVDGLVNALTR